MFKKLLLSLIVGLLPQLLLAKETTQINAGKKKLHFLENSGQITNQDRKYREDIQFSVSSGNTSIFIGNGQVHYQFSKIDNPQDILTREELFTPEKTKKNKIATSTYRMDVELVGSNTNAEIVKEEKQSFVSRFYTTKRTTHSEKVTPSSMVDAYSYDKVTYKNIYPNIDWVIYSKDNKLEYDFVIRPGGKASDIKIKYTGATALYIAEDGSLVAATPFGQVSEEKPFSFQSDGKEVASSFRLDGSILSFNVGSYAGTLTIDPSLVWGTYYGYTGDEEYFDMKLDGAGKLYAVGYSNSTDFIATDGSLYIGGTTYGYDGFISSFNTDGTLNWTTYWNTAGDDYTYRLALGGGNVYIAASNDALGDFDAYMVAISTSGVFDYALYWGDLGADYGYSVATDNAGSIYFAGMTSSTANISLPGAYQISKLGPWDGFVAKVNSGGTVAWSTYYGGTANDMISIVQPDNLGSLYIVGSTNSTALMANVGQTTFGGVVDVYLAKFNTTTGLRDWGTYVGGSGFDDYTTVAVSGGDIYVGASTESTNAIATPGTAQQTLGGGQDAFLAKYNNAGTKVWGTYYGGTVDDAINSITVDPATNAVYIIGATNSTNLNILNGFQTTAGGFLDGYLAKFNPSNGTISWSSYFGGAGYDRFNAIEIENSNDIYVCGFSSSLTGMSTPGALQEDNFGLGDAFVARFSDCINPTQPGTISGANPVCAGVGQTYTIPAVPGATSYTWTLPGGWTGTSAANSIFATVGTTGGPISVTANNACGSSTAQTLNVTVNPVPTATITAAGPTTFCQGSNVVLNASTGTGYSWAWFQGATPVGTNSSSYTANATGNYTVQITANGCSATSTAVSVTVNPAPPTPTASSNSPLCVGPSIFFTCTSTPGATYSWSGPNSFASTVQNPVISGAQIVNAGIYTVTVTIGGCSSSDTTYMHVADAMPATPMVSGDISICEFSTGNVYATGNDPNVAYYTWTLPVGWTGSGTTSSITTAAGSAGTSQISTIAINGCGASPAGILNVTVNANPVATITQSGNTLTVTGTYASYQWYNGAGLISGATTQSYNAPASGSYYCIVTDANGCTGTSNTLIITVGVNNVSKVSSVSLYPNPNTGSFTIEGVFASNDGKANIAIVDVAGRIVQTQKVSVSNNKLSVRIEMTGSLAAGVYTIKVSSDAANAIIPFVKN